MDRHPSVDLARCAVADRDLRLLRLPPVAVGDLPGQVGRALVAAGCEERGSNAGHVLLQDRDAARVAVLAQVIQDHRGRYLGVLVEHLGDRVLVGIELRSGWLTDVAPWLLELEEPHHSWTAHAEPPCDRGLAQLLTVVQPAGLRPVVH
jgi:hypothetical protein